MTAAPSLAHRDTSAFLSSIAPLIASSTHRALGCDALKDEDNAGWVLRFEPAVRAAWIERLRPVRLADRLAENQRLDRAARRFTRFAEGWAHLRAGREPPRNTPHAGTLRELRAALLAGGESHGALLAASWAAYLEALGDYHAGVDHDMSAPRTLAEHDRMLRRLSGPIFQLVPYLESTYFEAAARFGALDQFFNNLRDVAEDAAHGICNLPLDVLGRFGLGPGDLLGSRRCARAALMAFWLDEHLPSLRAGAESFLGAVPLHPSIVTMRAETLRRHARIEAVLREVDFDFGRFPARYWETLGGERAAACAA